MNDLKAAVFDMDGLLIDSEPFWRRAQVKVFSEVGLYITEADTEQTMGVRIDEAVQFWFDRHPWPEPHPAVVAETIVDEVIRLVESEGELMPGVLEALELLSSLKIPVGLATSSSERLIDAILSAVGLTSAFSVKCSAAEEAFGKPHPGVFLTAASRLGVEAATCLAFEDSVFGVQAAKAAGMKVIAVPAPSQYHLPAFDDADIRLESLHDFTLETIQTLYPSRRTGP